MFGKAKRWLKCLRESAGYWVFISLRQEASPGQTYYRCGYYLNHEHRADRRSPIEPPLWAPKVMRPGIRKPALAASMIDISGSGDG